MPRPSAARSSRPTAGPTVRPASLVLCADLTVPDGVECTLNVPRLSFLQTRLGSSRRLREWPRNAQVNVTDSKGGPVGGPDVQGRRRRLLGLSGEVLPHS